MYQQAISQFMSASVQTISIEATLDEARRLMQAHGIARLPVLSGSRLVGMLYATDLLDTEAVSIADAMRMNFASLRQTETLRDALTTLLDSGDQALPVVDEDHHFLGAVTAMNVLKQIVEPPPAVQESSSQESLVEIRSQEVPQPSDEDFHRALLAAHHLHTTADPEALGRVLLYIDRRVLALDKLFNAARRYFYAGQSPQELTRVRRAIEEVRDFEEKAGQSRRIPAGRM